MKEVLHGDCLEILKRLPDNSVDALVREAEYHKIAEKRMESA